MKLTARNDQVTIKSQSKPDFTSGKYGYWRKYSSLEKSQVRALTIPRTLSTRVCHLLVRGSRTLARATRAQRVLCDTCVVY